MQRGQVRADGWKGTVCRPYSSHSLKMANLYGWTVFPEHIQQNIAHIKTRLPRAKPYRHSGVKHEPTRSWNQEKQLKRDIVCTARDIPTERASEQKQDRANDTPQIQRDVINRPTSVGRVCSPPTSAPPHGRRTLRKPPPAPPPPLRNLPQKTSPWQRSFHRQQQPLRTPPVRMSPSQRRPRAVPAASRGAVRGRAARERPCRAAGCL